MAQLLLVEDNEPNRKLLARRLKSKGYEVIEAADGQEGIEKATAELPGLILMDLDLPKLDGWEATRQLKASPATAHIPIMAITAHAMVGDRTRALEAGCDEYEAKPVQLPRLLEKIVGFLSPASSGSLTRNAGAPPSTEAVTQASTPAPDVQSTPVESLPNIAKTPTAELQLSKTLEESPVSSITEESTEAPASPTNETAGSFAGTILVVDDILNNRKLLIRRLGRKGYKVLAVESGLAALDAIANDSSIDLVLLDIMMPGMDGIETLGKIRQTHSSHELPIIMATAKDTSRDMVTAFSKGANDYITKPIDFPVALARIQAQITMLRAMQGSLPDGQAPLSKPEPVAPPASITTQETPQQSDLRLATTPAKASPNRHPRAIHSEQQQVQPQSQGSPLLPPRFDCIEVLSEDAFGITASVSDTKQVFIRKNCLLEEIKSSSLGQQAHDVEKVSQQLEKHQQAIQAIRERGFNTRLVDVVEQDNNFYILQKMNRGQCLQAKLSQQSQPESMADVLKLIAALLRAINPLHQCQFTHAYLRAQDFHYLENSEFLVLTNLGLRQRLLWDMAANDGTISSSLEQAHLAPEARQGNPCLASDLYSIGIIGLQALTGKPADELPVDSRGCVDWEAIVPLSDAARDIFQNLLSPSPQLRFSSTSQATNEIMSQWFKQSQMRAA